LRGPLLRSRAQYADFDPLWEFVAGPLNAGSFVPNALDDTFGPQLVFRKAPPAQNTSPLARFQFFGDVQIDLRSRQLTVSFVDLGGSTVFQRSLEPQRG
jgi:alkaline phosphatase D